MKKKVIPIFSIGQHCDDKAIASIKISSFSEEACTIAEFEENHRHAYYEIIWLKNGKGVHTIDTIPYSYSGSVLFLLSPGQMHVIKPIEKADGYVIKFLPSLFNDSKDMNEYLLSAGLFDNIQAQPLLKVSSSSHAVFADVFSKMVTEFNADEEDKEKILLAYLKILITHINRLKRNHLSKQLSNRDINFFLFQNYKVSVENHFKKEHSVQRYAEILNTQARTLNSLSKKYLKKTAGEIISDRLILEAKRELYHNTNSIKEISYDLGFEDPAYFTRFFKKHTGISPQEYRVSNNAIIKLKAG